ncbi:hypothetical protein V6Z11_D06G083700 [Gossypium hirsutum]
MKTTQRKKGKKHGSIMQPIFKVLFLVNEAKTRT